jgi:GxxExxY protein
MALADLPEVNRITSTIIKAAIEVHRHLGPGLLESVYIACLAFELREAGLSVRTEQQLPVDYNGIKLGFAFRLDLVVNDVVIVEVKSIRALAPVHDSQLITYLKLTGCPAGLLINFNVPLLKNGLKRRLNPTPTL